jgi:cellulose synthase/poly-beta-1,6-N-acetylglucosamine synthase-like glycosyltransferase
MDPRADLDGPVSVVLPTRRWTAACTELADQIRPDDELLLVCDRPDDPVVDAAAGSAAEVVVAGEPTGCSAKCHALAAGLERATGAVIVCTDADFEHGPAWLSRVLAHPAGTRRLDRPRARERGAADEAVRGARRRRRRDDDAFRHHSLGRHHGVSP